MRWTTVARFAGGYPFALAAVAAAVAVLLPARPHLQSSTIMLAVVSVIMLVARLTGPRPSALAAIAGFLALDVLFVPPYYQLTVSTPAEWIALVTFLAVALLTGQQTARLRERESAAVRRFSELELLNDLAFRLTSEHTVESTGELVVGRIAEVLRAQRAAVYVDPSAVEPVCLAATGERSSASAETAMVGWVGRNGKAIGLDVAALPVDERPVSVAASSALADVTADGVYLPLHTGYSLEGVLYVRWPARVSPSSVETRLLVAISNLAAAALGRQRVEELASRTEALRHADALKSTLVSSVSHELRTPLAAATARLGGLLEANGLPAEGRAAEEVAATLGDLSRLDAAIADLLDMSRLESDAWRPRFEPAEVGDILGTVLARLPEPQRSRVRFELAADLPAIDVDFAQVARALANIVHNALVYSPAGEPAVVGARVLGPDVLVWVEDRGPGVAADERLRVFDKFFRGAVASAYPGTGLGLTIASEIVRAHGGRLSLEEAEPHGARFTAAFPIMREGQRREGAT